MTISGGPAQANWKRAHPIVLQTTSFLDCAGYSGSAAHGIGGDLAA